jgi:hypothetical protein
MDLDERIATAKDLNAKSEETDRRLAGLFGFTPVSIKAARARSSAVKSIAMAAIASPSIRSSTL